MSFPSPAARFCSFSAEFLTFSCCFQNVFNFPVASFLNCTPFVRQYGILSNKWGVFLCQRDIESPLTTIRAYTEALLEGVAPDEAARQRYLQTIYARETDL